MPELGSDFVLVNRVDSGYADNDVKLTFDCAQGLNVLKGAIYDNRKTLHSVGMADVIVVENENQDHILAIVDENHNTVEILDCHFTITSPKEDGFCLCVFVDRKDENKIKFESF